MATFGGSHPAEKSIDHLNAHLFTPDDGLKKEKKALLVSL